MAAPKDARVDLLSMLPQTITLAQTLPEGGMIPLLIGLGAGLALWLAGVKIVRAVFIALGAAAGGFVGAVLMPLTGLPAFNLGAVTLTPGFTGLIAGGIIGALVALAMLRVVVVITAAAAMGVVGVMAALVFLHFSPTGPGEDGAPAMVADGGSDFDRLSSEFAARTREQTEQALELLDRSNGSGSALLDGLNTEENRERIRDAAERSRAFLEGVAARGWADYERRPARDRLVILSSTLAGIAVGLLTGVAMPRRSSALVTSLAGSALGLASGVALVRANADPDPAFLTQPPLVWAVVWGVAAVLGMAVQSGLMRRKGKAGGEGEEE